MGSNPTGGTRAIDLSLIANGIPLSPDAFALMSLAVLGLVLVECAKTLRWWIFLGPGAPGLPHCLRALVAGQLTNALLPLRAGDAVRIGIIVWSGSPLTVATVSIAAAKAIDALCLAGIALLIVGVEFAGLRWIPPVLAVCGLVAIVWVRREPAVAQRLIDRVPLLRKVRIAELAVVLASIGPRQIAVALTMTVIVWTCGTMTNLAVLAAAGIAPTIDLAARMLVGVYLAGLAPAPPARVVVFEGVVAGALMTAQVEPTAAAFAGLLLHGALLVELGALFLIANASTWLRRR